MDFMLCTCIYSQYLITRSHVVNSMDYWFFQLPTSAKLLVIELCHQCPLLPVLLIVPININRPFHWYHHFLDAWWFENSMCILWDALNGLSRNAVYNRLAGLQSRGCTICYGLAPETAVIMGRATVTAQTTFETSWTPSFMWSAVSLPRCIRCIQAWLLEKLLGPTAKLNNQELPLYRCNLIRVHCPEMVVLLPMKTVLFLSCFEFERGLI